MIAADARAQANGNAEPATRLQQERAAKLAIAESVIAREEAASERAFDSRFRAQVKGALAGLPMAAFEAQQSGLGIKSLGDSQADLVYTPVAPCRIIDTRLAGGVIGAGTTRDFLVTGTNLSSQGGSATGCGVPFGPATAAVINLVAVSPAGQGDLRITPFASPIPLASIVNYAAVPGLNIANGPVVALCDPSTTTCSKDMTIQADGSATHLVADVQGYFRRVATGGVSTALLADSAVTAPKISTGVVVRSLNAQTDTVSLAGSNGLSVSQGSGTVTVASNATNANTPGAIVSRDGSGDFSAGTVTLLGNLALANTSSASAGVLTKGGVLFLHNSGTENTFVGKTAGNNTSMVGADNSGFGSGALQSNTSGNNNSALGVNALFANTTGNNNSAFGFLALSFNTGGTGNSAFGYTALRFNTTGTQNAAFGYAALQNSTTDGNSAFGYNALGLNTVGIRNSAFGNSALAAVTSGNQNSAFGQDALKATTANANSAFGNGALATNTAGYENSALGDYAMFYNTTGSWNVALGIQALYLNTTGNRNVAVGSYAGVNATTGSNNIYLGNDVVGVAGESNTVYLGLQGTQTKTFIAGIRGITTVNANAIPVMIDSAGQLGTVSSSRRFKEDIHDMAETSRRLLQLRPVAFRYKQAYGDGSRPIQYGLIAEEVAEVFPELAVRNAEGDAETVHYETPNVLLLNELQMQQRSLDQQAEALKRQQRHIEALEQRLDDVLRGLATPVASEGR